MSSAVRAALGSGAGDVALTLSESGAEVGEVDGVLLAMEAESGAEHGRRVARGHWKARIDAPVLCLRWNTRIARRS